MRIKNLRPCLFLFFIMILLILFIAPSFTFAQKPGQVKSYYSPIVRLEPEKGFLLITNDSGIMWIQVEDHAKIHLRDLGVGDMIDVTVQFRPDNLPPLLQKWKLAKSESPCKIFNGKSCGKE